MKKHKFSDKLPELGKKIVAKVEDNDVDIFIAKTSEFIDFPRLYRVRKTQGIGKDVYFLDRQMSRIDWWADPEEEE